MSDSTDSSNLELPKLRQLLDSILKTDPELDSFCIDYFPQIKKRFTNGMERLSKVNLLLEVADTMEVVDNLLKYDKASTEKQANILKADLPSNPDPTQAVIMVSVVEGIFAHSGEASLLSSKFHRIHKFPNMPNIEFELIGMNYFKVRSPKTKKTSLGSDDIFVYPPSKMSSLDFDMAVEHQGVIFGESYIHRKTLKTHRILHIIGPIQRIKSEIKNLIDANAVSVETLLELSMVLKWWTGKCQVHKMGTIPISHDLIQKIFVENNKQSIAIQVQANLSIAFASDSEILQAIRVRRWVRNLPRNLEEELSEVFSDVADVRRLINDARGLLAEACPDAKALPVSYVALGGGARLAWESAIGEAGKVGPQALIALLLAARSSTTIELPNINKAIEMILRMPS